MAIYTIKYAKAHWLDLLDAVDRGEDVIIARRTTPIVRLILGHPAVGG